jgi:leader peptidase (prepilin peptidase)/N-methyltransferase
VIEALTVGFALVLGAVVGSFLNVVADRVPAGASITSPGSHCLNCGHVLRPYELVPVLSYLALRGRCRSCGVRIGVRSPLVEAANAGLWAFAAWHYGPGLAAGLTAVAFSFLLVVAVIDLEHQLVLNSVLLACAPLAMGAALAWPAAVRQPVWDFSPRIGALGVDALAAAGLGFTLFLLLAVLSRGGIGGGDVKLAAVLGLWVGMERLAVALLVAVVLGGLVAGVLLLMRSKGRKDTIPFAPFLCLGAALSLVWGATIGNWYIQLIT